MAESTKVWANKFLSRLSEPKKWALIGWFIDHEYIAVEPDSPPQVDGLEA
jgi:hypothetical protein